jgi:hypothetical protein
MEPKDLLRQDEFKECDQPIYLRNLVESLKQAKERNDIERVILYASELERYKVLCGYSPSIQLLEESMKRVARELGIEHYPEIRRSLELQPEKTCSLCSCNNEKTTKTIRGFTIYTINSNGNLGIPEPEKVEPTPQPIRHPTRNNAENENAAAPPTTRKPDGSERGKSFLNRRSEKNVS